MDFIYEENRVLRDVRKNSCKILGLIQSRCAGHADLGAHFVGNNGCKSRFPESRRTDEEYVVKSLTPVAGGLDEYSEIVLYLLLSLKILEILGSQDILLGIGLLCGGRHD